jgi:3-methyladenine DNA glycosylase AlkD
MRACDIFSGYVARTPLAHAKMVEWTPRPEEWVARTGWLLVAQLALHDTTLADAGFLPYLDVIESEIHARPNRVRDAMNNALIALALRSGDL